jgi:hypothetical protein
MSNLMEPFVLEPASYDPERVIPLGFLSEEELGLFSLLIRHRRALPVYLGGAWRCGACLFESSELSAMVGHAMKTHRPAPVNEEDRIEYARGRRASA